MGIDLPDPDVASEYTWQEFPEGVSWTPERLEVNGNKNRRVIGNKNRRVICVLAQDGFHYRVYDLDSPSAGEDVQDTETDGGDEIMA